MRLWSLQMALNFIRGCAGHEASMILFERPTPIVLSSIPYISGSNRLTEGFERMSATPHKPSAQLGLQETDLAMGTAQLPGREALEREVLRALNARSNGRGLLHLAGHLAAIGVTGLLVHLARAHWDASDPGDGLARLCPRHALCPHARVRAPNPISLQVAQPRRRLAHRVGYALQIATTITAITTGTTALPRIPRTIPSCKRPNRTR